MVEKLNDIIDIDKIRFADWIQNGETQTHEEVEEECLHVLEKITC